MKLSGVNNMIILGITMLIFGLIGFLLVKTWLKDLAYTSKQLLLLVGSILLISGIGFFLFFPNIDNEIQIYDATVYWIKTIDGKDLLFHSISAYFRNLYETLTQEYTGVAAFPLMFFTELLGESFANFCRSIYFAYYVPTCLFLTIYATRLYARARDVKVSTVAFICCFLICLINVNMLWPIKNGYVDVAGLLLVAIMLNISLGWDGVAFKWKQMLGLATLGVLLVLTRRWYAYYVVGFFFAYGIRFLYYSLTEEQFSVAKLGRLLLNMLLIAIVAIGLVLIIDPDIFALFLQNDYADAYAAYKSMGILGNIWSFGKNFGLILVLISGLGVNLLFRSKQVEAKSAAVQLVVATLTAVILFSFVQDLSYHHQYLYLPMMLTFVCVSGIYATQYMLVKRKPFLFIPLMLAVVLNVVFAYVPAVANIATFTQPVTTAIHHYPSAHPNYDVIETLVDDLTAKTEHTLNKIYVVGDNEALSAELLKRISLPEETVSLSALLQTKIVDTRDGFPSHFFLADYVVMLRDFQSGFDTIQHIGYQIHDLLLNDSTFAQYYHLDSTYPTNDNQILVFKKVKDSDTKLVNLLSKRLQTFYPDNPFVYQPNYFIALAEIKQATYFEYNFYAEMLNFRKNSDDIVELAFYDTSDFTTMSFDLSCWNDGLMLRIENQDGAIVEQALPTGERTPYHFDVSDSEFLIFTIYDVGDTAGDATILLFDPVLV